MIALLKKDWRNNRVAVAGGLALIAMPHVVVTMRILLRPVQAGHTPSLYDNAAEISLFLTAVTAAVFAGAAFAQERRERSADFLGMLPVSRARIIVSKLIVACACLLVFAAINFTVTAITRSAFLSRDAFSYSSASGSASSTSHLLR